MALSTRSFRETTDKIWMRSKWRERETISPERTRVWSEPKAKAICERRVPVVYYLCRNGQLDHPHFMEVPLFSIVDGLYLRDVIKRLNELRGEGMASLYSWSSKRSYRTGFVWHDLSENDFIYPAHGQEYILKGSEVLPIQNARIQLETTTSRSPRPQEQSLTGESAHFPVTSRRRNQSWSSIDLGEYKVLKPAESSAYSTCRVAANASTQTDHRIRRRKPDKVQEIEESSESACGDRITELARDEVSPPPSDNSPGTLETLMKADGKLILCGNDDDRSIPATAGEVSVSGGRMKASAVLMQLISCGTMSFRDRCSGPGFVVKESGTEKEFPDISGVKLEEKEYFSGSLIETKKKLPSPTLTRSWSYGAKRSSRIELVNKEIDNKGMGGKCIPRKPKGLENEENKS